MTPDGKLVISSSLTDYEFIITWKPALLYGCYSFWYGRTWPNLEGIFSIPEVDAVRIYYSTVINLSRKWMLEREYIIVKEKVPCVR